MAVTASQLRQDIYRLLDRVLASGEPLEIERKGRRLRVVADEPPTAGSKFDRMPVNSNLIIGDPDEVDDVDWIQYWEPDV